jgi:putative SOS response-associated peptidase YedK
MCGRFTLRTPGERLAEDFELAETPEDLAPRYNIAPGQAVAVVRPLDERRVLEHRRWGLVPAWARDASVGARMINARSESAAEKPAFREAFRRRRCLVPADGFYEWKKGTAHSGAQPWFLEQADSKPFAIAGLFESWTPRDGEPLDTCTLLTCEAQVGLRALHPRMPVVLGRELWQDWLDPELCEPEQVSALLARTRPVDFRMHPVSPRVNHVDFDEPACVQDVPEAQPSLF